MPLRVLLFTLALLIGGRAQADIINYVPMPELAKALSEGALCSTRAIAALCRHLPWSPRLHEGVVELSGSAFVFLERKPVEGSTLAKWRARFAEEKELEYTSYFAIHTPGFAQSLQRSTVSTVFVMMVDREGDRIIPRSLLMSDKASVMSLTAQRFQELAGELNAGQGEWIPPEDFAPAHQFKLLE